MAGDHASEAQKNINACVLIHGRVRNVLVEGITMTDTMRAVMMYGARLARGCTSGQALSGGAVLSVGSFAFMFAIFASAYLLALPLRRLWN